MPTTEEIMRELGYPTTTSESDLDRILSELGYKAERSEWTSAAMAIPEALRTAITEGVPQAASSLAYGTSGLMREQEGEYFDPETGTFQSRLAGTAPIQSRLASEGAYWNKQAEEARAASAARGVTTEMADISGAGSLAEYIGQGAARMVPRMLPALGAAALTAPAGGAGAIPYLAAFGVNLPFSAGDVEQQAAERGIEPTRGSVTAHAIPHAALDSITDVLMGTRWASRLTKSLGGEAAKRGVLPFARKILSDVGLSEVSEVPTELIQTVLERDTAGQDLFSKDAIAEYKAVAGETALATIGFAGAGGAVSSIGGPAGERAARAPREDPRLKARERMSIMLQGNQLNTDELLSGDVEYGAGKDQIFNRDIYIAQLNKAIRSTSDPKIKKSLQELRKKVKAEQEALREGAEYDMEAKALELPQPSEKPQQEFTAGEIIYSASDNIENQARTQDALVTNQRKLEELRFKLSTLPLDTPQDVTQARPLVEEIAKLELESAKTLFIVRANDNDAQARAIQANRIYDNVVASGGDASEALAAASQSLDESALRGPATQLTLRENFLRTLQTFAMKARPSLEPATARQAMASFQYINNILASPDSYFGSPTLADPLSQQTIAALDQFGLKFADINSRPQTPDVLFTRGLGALFGKKVMVIEYDPSIFASNAAGAFSVSTPEMLYIGKMKGRSNVPLSRTTSHEIMHSLLEAMPLAVRDSMLKATGAFEAAQGPIPPNVPPGHKMQQWEQYGLIRLPESMQRYYQLLMNADYALASGDTDRAMTFWGDAEITKQKVLNEYVPEVFERNMTNRQMWESMVKSNQAFGSKVTKDFFRLLDALDKSNEAVQSRLNLTASERGVDNFMSAIVDDRVSTGQIVSLLADLMQQRLTLASGERINVGISTPTEARPVGTNEYPSDTVETSLEKQNALETVPIDSDMLAAKMENDGRTLIAESHRQFVQVLDWIIEQERMGQTVKKDDALDLLVPILNRMSAGFDQGYTAFGLSIGPQERAAYEEAARARGDDPMMIAEGVSDELFPDVMKTQASNPRPSVAIPHGHGVQFVPQQRLQRIVHSIWQLTTTNPILSGRMRGIFEGWATTPYAFDKAFPTYDLSDPTSQANMKMLSDAGITLLNENSVLRSGKSKGMPLGKDPAYQLLKDFVASLGKTLYVVEIDAQKANVDAFGSFSRTDPESIVVFKPFNFKKGSKFAVHENLNVAAVGFHEIMHSVFSLLPDSVQDRALRELGAVTERSVEMRSGVQRNVAGLEVLMHDVIPRLTSRHLHHELGIDMEMTSMKANGASLSSMLAGVLMNLETHANRVFGSDLFGDQSVVATHMQFPEVANAATLDPKALANLSDHILGAGMTTGLIRSEYFAIVMEKMFSKDPKLFIESVIDFSADSVRQILLPMFEKMEALESVGVDLKNMGVESGSEGQLKQERELAFTFGSLTRGVRVLSDALERITSGEPSIIPLDFGFPEDELVGKGQFRFAPPYEPHVTGVRMALPSGAPVPLAAVTKEGRQEAQRKRIDALTKRWKKAVDGIRDSGAERQQVGTPRPNRGTYREHANDFLKAKKDKLKILGNVFYMNPDGDVTVNWGEKSKDGKINYKPIKVDPMQLMRKIREAALASRDPAAALGVLKKYYHLADRLNLTNQIDEIRTEVSVKFASQLLEETHPLKPIVFFNSYLQSMEDQLEKQAGPLGGDLVRSGKSFRARVARRLSQFMNITGREKPGSKEWQGRIDVRLNKFTEEERENFWDWVAAPAGSTISFPAGWSTEKRQEAMELVSAMKKAKDWMFTESQRVWGPAIAKALEEHAPKYYKHDILKQLLRGKVDKNPAWMRVINQIKQDQAKFGRQLTDEEAQSILDRAVGAMITWNREGLGAMIGKGPEAGALTHGRRLDLPFGYEKDPLIWFFRYMDEGARFIAWGETMRVPASRFAANLEKLAIDDEHRKTVTAYFKDYLKALSNRSIRNEGEEFFPTLTGESRWEQVLKFWIDLRLLSPNSWGANASQLWEIVNVAGFRDNIRAVVDLLSKRAPLSPHDGAALDSVHAGLIEFSKLAKSGQRMGAGTKELMWNALQPFQMVEYWLNRTITPKLSQALLWHYADGAFKAMTDPTNASPKDYRSLVMLRNFVYDMDGLFKLWEEAGHVVLTDDILAEAGYAGTQGTQLAQTPEAAPRGSRKAKAAQLTYVFRTFQIKRFWNVIHRLTDGQKINAERYAQIEQEKMKATPDMKRIVQLEKEIGAERAARNAYAVRLAATSPIIGSMMQAAMFGLMGRFDESTWYEMYRKYEQGNLGLGWHDFQDYMRMYLESVMYISMVGVVLDIADRVLLGQGGVVDSVSRYLLGPVFGYVMNFANNLYQTGKGMAGDPSARTLKEGAVELAGDIVGGGSRLGLPGKGNPTWRERYGDVDIFMNIQRKRFSEAIQKGDFALAAKIREGMLERYPEWAIRKRERRIEDREDFLEHDLFPPSNRR